MIDDDDDDVVNDRFPERNCTPIGRKKMKEYTEILRKLYYLQKLLHLPRNLC